MALRISCANGDGSVRSRATTRIAPASMPLQQPLQAVARPSPRAGSPRWSGRRADDRAPRARRRGSPGRRPGRGRRRRAGRRRACARAAAGPCLPPRKRGSASERPAFQRQRVLEHRRVEQRLDQNVLDAVRIEIAEDVLQREAVRGPSESTMASSVAAACSSKSKPRQKRLRSARPQARLMRAAEGRVDDELHAAGFVEEALEHDVSWRRQARRARACAAARYSTAWSAAASAIPSVARRPRAAPMPPAGSSPMRAPRRSARRRDTAATARRCGPALRRARREWSAARPARPPRAPARARRAGCARTCCRAGRCRRPCSRWRSLR